MSASTLTLHVATINVPGSVGLAGWRDCFHQATARGTDFTGMNEVGHPAAKVVMRNLIRAAGLSQFGLFRGPNPIIRDPHRWDRTGGATRRLHPAGTGPLARRFPGYSSARSATVTVNESNTDLDAPEVTVIETHWVPRGRKVPAWWRNRMVRRSREVITRLVQAHLDAGHIVIIMGDLNMERAPAIPHVRWIVDNGVDKIGVAVPKGVRLVAHQGGLFPASTDHKHGAQAVLTFTY